MNIQNQFTDYASQVAKNFTALAGMGDMIERACLICETALKNNHKIIFIGNGGSAADSQHLSAELVGRYLKNRPALSAMALTTDTSALTAIGNDFGYDHVFARQLEGVGQKGDVLYAISTSGNSPNIIKAIEVAKNIGITAIGVSGGEGGKMKNLCDHNIIVPSQQTNHIQEMHIAIGHFICGYLEEKLQV